MQGFFKRREFLADFKAAEASRAGVAAGAMPSLGPDSPP